ncbi:YfaZ family protein [Erwinia tracheiphila]|uniref:Porin n=1 Tax=Erwinia tracheiphila TaxID=65700 RepID=A0A0M2KLP6_9GAMM|nr:YfaZ family outer membrane protein [Erwinia tracheiphila]AXF77943.1 porin [Erwinia tracheiphila]KKF37916.1 porin [Erwinia tracheiphila]UIA83350.1 YfaZ family protein [Erwinia tracheiphila]UIA88466.1 YfaZ family protein [Erwinia tracheiphila]UIA91900.1 YfaZ family protein [Erwinia tracheiphila]
MKAVATTAGVLALLVLAGSAQAIEGGVDVGRQYTNLHAGLGNTSPGFALTGNWLRSDHDGSMGSVGMGYNVVLGDVFLTPGAKVISTNPRNSKDGYAVAVGLGTSVPVTNMFNVYGQYYYSPDTFSSHIDNYQEASAGVSFQPISLVDVHVGYQYMALNGKNGRKDNVLADGPYVGASLHF